jgi:2-dehydro-3-deoxyphosphooctonate aldolase (KDO 8-P synthase)
LSRAAVATGIDALFIEAHPSPDQAPCDGPCQIDFEALDAVVAEVRAIERALGAENPQVIPVQDPRR